MVTHDHNSKQLGSIGLFRVALHEGCGKNMRLNWFGEKIPTVYM